MPVIVVQIYGYITEGGGCKVDAELKRGPESWHTHTHQTGMVSMVNILYKLGPVKTSILSHGI